MTTFRSEHICFLIIQPLKDGGLLNLKGKRLTSVNVLVFDCTLQQCVNFDWLVLSLNADDCCALIGSDDATVSKEAS